MAREMLCFTMETGALGREARVRAMFALCSRYVPVASK